jgi:hypothetical protein
MIGTKIGRDFARKANFDRFSGEVFSSFSLLQGTRHIWTIVNDVGNGASRVGVGKKKETAIPLRDTPQLVASSASDGGMDVLCYLTSHIHDLTDGLLPQLPRSRS